MGENSGASVHEDIKGELRLRAHRVEVIPGAGGLKGSYPRAGEQGEVC
jgi:hypothetical protein